MRPLCIYHGNCADGFTSAWVVNRALDGEVDFHPGVYGEPAPDIAGRDVIMVDFSYKRAVLDQIVADARTVLILDHHKTAQEDLAGIPPPGNQSVDAWRAEFNRDGTPPVRAIFDMERSGAQITWDYFLPGTSRPLLVDYVADRDLWRFKMMRSREVNAYVFAHKYDFGVWEQLAMTLEHEGITVVARLGAAIELKHHKDVAELVAVTRRSMKLAGMVMPVANVPYTLSSDAGHLMASQSTGQAAACYWDTPSGRVFSLRSTELGPDVSEIAKHYGGGGHPHAAGFQASRGWEGEQE